MVQLRMRARYWVVDSHTLRVNTPATVSVSGLVVLLALPSLYSVSAKACLLFEHPLSLSTQAPQESAVGGIGSPVFLMMRAHLLRPLS